MQRAQYQQASYAAALNSCLSEQLLNTRWLCRGPAPDERIVQR